jgi:hypothetical protein
VLSRLPGEITSELRENTKFQIVASDDFQDACVLSRRFPSPMRTVTGVAKPKESMLAGIMRAINEMEWLQHYSPQACDIRSL